MKVKNNMLKKYAKSMQTYCRAAFLCKHLGVCAALIPRLMVDIIDSGIMIKDMGAIVSHGLAMLLATVLNIVSLMISVVVPTRVTAGISRDLRSDLFGKVIGWSKRDKNRIFQFHFNHKNGKRRKTGF